MRRKFEAHDDVALDWIGRHDPAAHVDPVFAGLGDISRKLRGTIMTFVLVSAEDKDVSGGEDQEQNDADNQRLLRFGGGFVHTRECWRERRNLTSVFEAGAP